MTIIDFLNLVEQHSFIVLYYSFSMLFSVFLGRLFLSRMGHPRIWNYFFSLLLYMMSVLGLFSLIMFFYQWFTGALTMSIWVVLVPFLTMVAGILLIYNRVNISLLTGFGSSQTFFAVLFLIILSSFLIDYGGWVSLSEWPVYLVFLFLIGITLIIQKIMLLWRQRD